MKKNSINKAFKYRIYPNKEQRKLIRKHFGCCRFVWNYFLNERKEYCLKNKEAIKEKRIKGSLNYYDNANDLIRLKKENEWLKECNSQSLQATLKNLEGAYRGFFRKTHRFPRFKKKRDDKQSFKIPQHIMINDNRIYFPKFSEGIKIKLHRKLQGRILSATLTKSVSDKYYICIVCECSQKSKLKNKNAVALDLGLKSFAVMSDGSVINNPKYLAKSESKLRYMQRKYSKHKGSKTKHKLQRLYERVTDQRNDFLHKLSSKVINENQVIIVEDLDTKGMLKNHRLAKSISDVSWSRFVGFLSYKSDWYGRELVKIDRFFPSSKTCSNCGFINQELTLQDRGWKCPSCKKILDRDFNASLNILKQGLNKCGRDYRIKPYELLSLEGAMTKETSTLREE